MAVKPVTVPDIPARERPTTGAPGRGPGRPAARRPGGLLHELRKTWSAYAFIAPGLLMILVFTVFAIAFSFWISFRDWELVSQDRPFVGLENYRDLADDPRFGRALVNTAYYTLVSVPLGMLVGLALALLLNKEMRARSMFRALFFFPSITPFVIAAIIWKWIYNGDYGLMNYYLDKLGIIDDPLLWLADPNLAMPAIILMSVWAGAGGTMILYLAGLQGISEDLYDAAKVDGAGAWHRLRYITFPMLGPTTAFLFVVGVIGSFQIFAQIFVMTNGGPLDRTTTIAYYIYQNGFKYFDMGYASAISYVLFAILLGFTVLQFRLTRRYDIL